MPMEEPMRSEGHWSLILIIKRSSDGDLRPRRSHIYSLEVPPVLRVHQARRILDGPSARLCLWVRMSEAPRDLSIASINRRRCTAHTHTCTQAHAPAGTDRLGHHSRTAA